MMEEEDIIKAEADIREFERKNEVSVRDLIDYLGNFDENDKVCYMDCVEGFRNDCTYVRKDQLGKRFFSRVSEHKEDMKKSGMNDSDDMFPYVSDEDVIMV